MVEKRKAAEGGEEAPTPAKRQRVSRACDQCRAAREKCDGIRNPGCFTCLSSNRECTYTTPPKKRGIQPGYIRTLELTLAWVFENCPGAESTLSGAIASDQIAALLSGKDSDGSYRLHRGWRKSNVCKELEKLLGSGKATSTPDADSAAEENIPQEGSTVSIQAPLTPATTGNTFVATLPSNIWRLFDVYFAYTHTWLPILQKHDILKLAYTYGEHGLHLSPTGPNAEHAELWALAALASTQEIPLSAPLDAGTSEAIYQTARRLIPDERGKQSISHVKAFLLLSLINISSEKWTAAWLQIGQAVNIALDLGLHAHSHSRSKHTMLACFLLERLLCSHLKRIPRLSSADIASLGPVEEEGLEEWETWSPCDGFSQHGKESRGEASQRAPSHTLSIFNQLVVLSNGLPGPSIGINLPPHLQASKTTTPQLVHLHILHSCCVGDVERAKQLLSEFTWRFGVLAMPAVFRFYVELSATGVTQASRGSLSVQLDAAPKPTMVLSGAPTGMQPEFVTSPVATKTPQTASTGPLGSKFEDMPPLERFKSNNSIDMEALFDELASLDGVDSADHQPIFMQNLGLAPNADLNDALFGFDPLLSTYMNAAPNGIDPSQGYSGG